jgi:hypothetical protein
MGVGEVNFEEVRPLRVDLEIGSCLKDLREGGGVSGWKRGGLEDEIL